MTEIDPKIFLEELQKEKKSVEKYIKQLENHIKQAETHYLESTANSGNILRGWEHIFTSKSNKIHVGSQYKKTHISNNERLFSQTFEFDKNILEENLNNQEKTSNPSISTIKSVQKADSPRNNVNGNVQNYKHKKKTLTGLKKKRDNATNDYGQNEKTSEQKNS